MRLLLSTAALLASILVASAAAPVATNIANFPSVSVAYTNYLAEGIVTNGLTVGGVRRTSWPTNSAIWGSITGTLSNQTDLQSALDGKVSKSGDTMTGTLEAPLLTQNSHIVVTNALLPFSAKTRLVFDGDSLTYGGNVATNLGYPTYFTNLVTANVVFSTNAATPGATITNRITNYVNAVYPHRPSGGTNAVLFCWIGINNICATADPLDVFNPLTNYWRTAKSDGFTLVAFTLADSAATPGCDLQRRQVNDMIRAAPYWDYLVDVDMILPTSDGTTYDNTHFKTNYNALIASEVISTIQAPLKMPSRKGYDPLGVTAYTDYQGRTQIPNGLSSLLLTNGSAMAYLYPDAANRLSFRNGTSPDTLDVYATYTDASNYTRLSIGGRSGQSARFDVMAENAGTGGACDVWMGTVGSGSFHFVTGNGDRWFVSTGGNFLAGTDNTYTIGTSGSGRPLGVVVGPAGGFGSTGTNVVTTSATGATNTLNYNVVLYVTAATSAALTDNAGTTEFSGVTIANFTPIRLQPGGKFTGTSITYATGTASHAW